MSALAFTPVTQRVTASPLGWLRYRVPGKRGYNVEAFDGSAEMTRRASELTCIRVKQMLFEELLESAAQGWLRRPVNSSDIAYSLTKSLQ
jgi:hypothetical protein